MATTTNFGWETPDDTDLVKDGAAAIRTALGGVDTSFVDLKGGTTGQVLSKASNTDLDFSWVAQDDSNAIQNAIVDAKGDLIAATAADTPARLAVGTNGQVLTADSTTATGLKWATAAGGGKVLQVVSATYATEKNTTSSTYADTGLTVTITPSASTSKVLVMITQAAGTYSTGSAQERNNYIQLLRGASVIHDAVYPLRLNGSTSTSGNEITTMFPLIILDSPATTSATTYKTQWRTYAGGATVQPNSLTSYITVMEIGA